MNFQSFIETSAALMLIFGLMKNNSMLKLEQTCLFSINFLFQPTTTF